MWIYPVYVLLLVSVVFLSNKLANLVDLLDKKTSISGAFIGGVLLAAVTSLPELFTAISAVLIVNEPNLVIGDILGSDIFNIMILGLYSVFFFKHFKDCKSTSWHIVSLLSLLAMYGLTIYAVMAPVKAQLMLGDINVVSIILFILYAVLLIKQPKESESSEEEVVDSKLTLKQIIIRFIICAVLLISVSIGITLVTDLISEKVSWLGGTIAGAILLGVATSLPEVISTFSLFRMKNFDAGIGNMVGSCTFNFSILVIADLMSWSVMNPIIAERGIYISNIDSVQLLLFGLISISSLLVTLVLKKFTKIFQKKNVGFITMVTLALVNLLAYLFVFII